MIGVLSGYKGDFISIKKLSRGPFAHSGSCLKSASPTSFAHVFFPQENREEQFRQSVLASSSRTLFCLPWRCGHLQLYAGGKEGAAADMRQPLTCPCPWLPDFPPNTKNDRPIPLSWNTDNPTGFLFNLESKWKLVFHPLLRNITKNWKYMRNILYFPS